MQSAILTFLLVLASSLTLVADEAVAVREARPLDPDSPDIVGQFHRVGFPKYTDVEKKIIDRAKMLQDEQAAIFKRVKVGRSVFDYPGLIAMGVIYFDPSAPGSYVLTFGIRPHISVFAGSFSEFQIRFNLKGVIESKRTVPSEWNQAEEASAGKPATGPESDLGGGQKLQPELGGRSR